MLRLLDNFGFYAFGQYARIYTAGGFGGPSDIGPYGPGGAPALRFSGNYSAGVDRSIPDASGATCIMQADLTIDSAPPTSNVLLAASLGSSIQCSCDINPDRTISVCRGFSGTRVVLATSTYVVPLSAEIHLGAKFTIANAGGRIIVHVWEYGDTAARVIIDVTADTQDLGSAAWDRITVNAASDGDTDWRNLVVMDGSGGRLDDLLGPVDVTTLRASARAAAALNDFALSSGTSVPALIADGAPDDDVSYVFGAAGNEQSTFVDRVPDPDREILGMQLCLAVKKSGSGSPTAAPILRQAGVNTDGAAAPAPSTYGYRLEPYSALPDFSAMTAAAVDALEWGIEAAV